VAELASKDDFFAPRPPRCVFYELPSGKGLFVEEVQHLESEMVTADLVKRRRQIGSGYDMQAKARFIVQCCTDGGPEGKGGGKPFFTSDDIPRIMKKFESEIAPLYHLCEVVNGIDNETAAAFKKKYAAVLGQLCDSPNGTETTATGVLSVVA
jgi:hypothetical protein